jgi:hypothetical protein
VTDGCTKLHRTAAALGPAMLSSSGPHAAPWSNAWRRWNLETRQAEAPSGNDGRWAISINFQSYTTSIRHENKQLCSCIVAFVRQLRPTENAPISLRELTGTVGASGHFLAASPTFHNKPCEITGQY